MPMTFGMHLGHVGGPMAEMRKLWRYADANGFDWFSSADHFQESPYRDGNGPCFEAISTMTAPRTISMASSRGAPLDGPAGPLECFIPGSCCTCTVLIGCFPR